MKITYDPQADALSIDLLDTKTARMLRVAENVNADFDAEGRLTSIEILGASDWYPAEQLKQLDRGIEWMNLAEAAEFLEQQGEPISADAIRVQINNQRIPAQKRGRDWVVAAHDLLNYLANRSPVGRRAEGSKSAAARLEGPGKAVFGKETGGEYRVARRGSKARPTRSQAVQTSATPRPRKRPST